MKTKSLLLALLLCFTGLGVAQAKEGVDQYPHGAENWLAGAVPPPGGYFINYSGYYSGKLKDGSANTVPDAKVGAWFNAFRYVRTTNKKILGGNWGWHVIAPVVSQKMELGGNKNTVSGLGDITIDPFILSWHSDNWHWATGLDILVPTGTYKQGEPTRSLGANYWSFEPLFAFTYLNKQGWEVSAKFMYNFKTANKDFRPAPDITKMKYKSGDEFHMDFLVGKHIGNWGLGVSGYYLQQTTNDKLDGAVISSAAGPWSRGRKGRVLAFGPSVNYSSKSGTQFIAQWQHETMVHNRFAGDKFWLKLIVPM